MARLWFLANALSGSVELESLLAQSSPANPSKMLESPLPYSRQLNELQDQ
jgi:hypothetical protein